MFEHGIWHYYKASGDDEGTWVKAYPRRSYVTAYTWNPAQGNPSNEYTVSNITSIVNFDFANSVRVEIDRILHKDVQLLVVDPVVVDITSLVKGMFSPDPLTQSLSSTPRYRVSIENSGYVMIYSNSLLVHLNPDAAERIGNIRFIIE